MLRRNMSIILAHMLDHFDANLYSFMAPIMAPLFFPKQDPVVQLILAYSFLATSTIARPIGALIFSWSASRYQPWKILKLTLIGVGASTMLTGFLPTFSQIGYYSAATLLAVRIIGGIFAEGEKAIAGTVLLENQNNKQAIRTNTWFGIALMLGCALASWAAYFTPANFWRVPFWCGGLLAFYAMILRFDHLVVSFSSSNNSHQKDIKPWYYGTQKTTLLSFVTVIFSGGLSYVTYDLSFIFINTYVPLITNITRQTMMEWNTILLIFDMIIFLPIGYLIGKYDAFFLKRLSVLMLMIPSIPMFYFMKDASLLYVLLVRFWIVIWGVVFSCVLGVWWLRLFPYKSKYFWIGIGGAIGSSLIGRSTSALCLWGWYKTHITATPGIYLCMVCLVVLLTSRNKFGNTSKDLMLSS